MTQTVARHPGRLRLALLRALPKLLPSFVIAAASLATEPEPTRLVVDAKSPTAKRLTLCLDVRAAATPNRIRETARGLRAALAGRPRMYPMLASSFLSPRVREICREERVGYIDLAGNCYIRLDDLYVEKVVEKNPFPARGRPASLFSPVSSRIIRVLLEEPTRSWQVSTLARVAEVSLGQASNVCRRLLDEEYLTKAQRRLSLARPAELLDAWREQDRPAKHTRLGYYSFEQGPERRMSAVARIGRRHAWPYAVTSFAAASLVAPFVRGVGHVELYLPDELAVERWVRELDLRPVEAGANLTLRVPEDRGVFYRSRMVQRIRLVGDIQLYLDLWTDPARGREQAEFLRKQRLGF